MTDDAALEMISRLYAVAHRRGRLPDAVRLVELLQERARGDEAASRGVEFYRHELADVLAEARVEV